MSSPKPTGPTLPVRILIVLLVFAVVWAGARWLLDQGHSPPAPLPDKGLLGRPLRVGVVYWPGYAGGLVANNGFAPNKSCLFWNNHKLQVEFVDIEDPAQLTAAFQKGGPDGIDIMWSTVDSWANSDVGLSKGGLKAKAIMQVDWSRGGDAIVADNSIRAIEDLRGKKLALIQYTPSHWLLEYNLANSGLNDAEQGAIEDHLVNVANQEAGRDAFLTNQVPAAVLWEPYVTEALKRPNSHILLSSETATDIIADIMIAKQDFIEQHPDVAQAFVSGWMEGATEANRHKDQAVKVLMENEPPYKAAGERATRDGLSKVQLAMPTDNTGMFGLDGKPSDWDRIFTKASERWLRLRVIPKTLTPAEAKDARFVRKNYLDNNSPQRLEEKPIVSKPGRQEKWIPKATYWVYFDTGSATLDSAAKLKVDQQILSYAQSNRAARLEIEGHTDHNGTPQQNQILSLERARAIVHHLVDNGINSSRLTATGKGDTDPRENNNTENGRRANRRVVIRLMVQEKSQ